MFVASTELAMVALRMVMELLRAGRSLADNMAVATHIVADRILTSKVAPSTQAVVNTQAVANIQAVADLHN